MIFIIPTAAAVAWLLRARDTTAAFVAKPLASTGFLAVAVSSGALESNYGRVVLGGLALGALGDVALMFDRLFLMGLIAFAAGHLAYVAAFIGVAGPTPVSSAVALAVAAGSAIWLLPRLDREWRAPVALYIVVISAMLAAALAPEQALLVSIGASLFAVSDLLVARERFIRSDRTNALWGLPLYYAGQILIALSVAN